MVDSQRDSQARSSAVRSVAQNLDWNGLLASPYQPSTAAPLIADQEVGGSIPSGHTISDAPDEKSPGASACIQGASQVARLTQINQSGQTMRRPPLFVSSNAGKVREIEAILGFPIEQLDLDLPEIQALDVALVARDKALKAHAAAGRTVFVEDTGLYLDHLGGLPGALVRWFLATIGPQGICDLLPEGADRSATARTAIALCDGGTVELLIGETSGTITSAPRGGGGFGWDAVFVPEGAEKTFAEMSQSKRDKFSMRRKAVDLLRERLRP